MVQYIDTLDGITAEHLSGGFFVGWLNPPSAEMHLRMLQGCYKFWLALDDDTVVGFVYAISDGVLTAFIPLLEVLPEYQEQGIGSELMRRLVGDLSDLYSIDLLCDDDVIPFYEILNMQRASGMALRNYANQSGKR